MTTEGSHPVRSLGSRPLKIPKYQRTHWEGLPVGEQARVLRPALEVEANKEWGGVEKQIKEEKGGGIRQEKEEV